MVEHAAVNRVASGSSPLRGASFLFLTYLFAFMSFPPKLREDKDEKIDRLEKRVDKLENTVKRLFQIMDAQIYPDEKPEDVS